jgi:hypothetical protein
LGVVGTGSAGAVVGAGSAGGGIVAGFCFLHAPAVAARASIRTITGILDLMVGAPFHKGSRGAIQDRRL